MSHDHQTITVIEPETVVVTDPDGATIIIEQETEVVTTVPEIEVIETVVTDTIVQTVPEIETIEVVGVGPQGPPGPQGPAGSGAAVEYLSAQALSAHRAVAVQDDGTVDYADNATPGDLNRLFGISLTATSAPGETLSVIHEGTVSEVTWSWTMGEPIYIGANGLLTQTAPTSPSAYFLCRFAYPTTPTSLYVDPKQPLVLI